MRTEAEAGAPVVVGIDGSAPSLNAVELAAMQARLHGRTLRIVHAYPWAYHGLHLRHRPGEPGGAGALEGTAREQAERVLAGATERAHRAAPGLAVHGEIVVDAPAAVLVRASRHAAMVVLGDRGRGGFAGLIVGSVAIQVATHAHCPVLVARGSAEPAGEVVVGVDGSPASTDAVGLAFAEAALRGAALCALHAWTHPVPVGPGDMLPLVYDVDEIESDEARLLAEAVAGWRDRYPEVEVRELLVRGRAAPALVEASAKAQLVVVGGRGHGGFAGLLLGSVSQAVLHHAGCPVMILRSGRDAA